MKQLRTFLLLSLLACAAMPISAAKKTQPQKVNSVKLAGYVGQRYNDCLERRVKTENLDTILSVFKAQDEVENLWGTEFWGKWVQGAIGMYHNTHDEQLKRIIQNAQERLIALQLPNGYIGDYDVAHQLNGWDVWGRKYTLLGLLKWYWETGDKRMLKAATRLLDYTIGQIGDEGKSIVKCGLYRGMPPSSILEPVMFMYQTTHNARYLDFAKYIARALDSDEGPQLIRKADVPVCQRFPVDGPDTWWSELNGQKAYEMMSCYVGLLELYRETGDETLLQAAATAHRHIVEEEINICGSGASYECWYHGVQRQPRVAMHTMETCVTFTWMQFNERLLELTHDPKYVDLIERTMYNALFASMKGDASQIAQYTPLEGYRHEGEKQCYLPINCCNANGPRAYAMIPRVQYRLPESNRVDVNLYIPGEANIQLENCRLTLTQETDYPKGEEIALIVNPDREAAFTLALRIPAWSDASSVCVNGEEQAGVQRGSYYLLRRTWKAGDRVELRVALKARVVTQGDFQALERGPIVLARDTRFRDGFVDESCSFPMEKDGTVALEPVVAPQGMWMAFRVKMLRGAFNETNEDKEDTYFCDFASAGNTWDKAERYRVWLPRRLNPQTERAVITQ